MLMVNVANYIEQQISALRSSLCICWTLLQPSEQRKTCFERLLYVGWVMSTSHLRRQPPFYIAEDLTPHYLCAYAFIYAPFPAIYWLPCSVELSLRNFPHHYIMKLHTLHPTQQVSSSFLNHSSHAIIFADVILSLTLCRHFF